VPESANSHKGEIFSDYPDVDSKSRLAHYGRRRDRPDHQRLQRGSIAWSLAVLLTLLVGAFHKIAVANIDTTGINWGHKLHAELRVMFAPKLIEINNATGQQRDIIERLQVFSLNVAGQVSPVVGRKYKTDWTRVAFRALGAIRFITHLRRPSDLRRGIRRFGVDPRHHSIDRYRTPCVLNGDPNRERVYFIVYVDGSAQTHVLDRNPRSFDSMQSVARRIRGAAHKTGFIASEDGIESEEYQSDKLGGKTWLVHIAFELVIECLLFIIGTICIAVGWWLVGHKRPLTTRECLVGITLMVFAFAPLFLFSMIAVGEICF
jgi:hypothetical protein